VNSLDPVKCLRELSLLGGVVCGVPCSGLGSLISVWRASAEWSHIAAVNEAEGVGVAAGAAVKGRSFVYLQNSGLGYTLDGLTSLIMPCDVAVTMIVSHRGLPDIETLPQHAVAGRLTIPFFEMLNIPFATCYESSYEAFNRAVASLPADRLSALILSPSLRWKPTTGVNMPSVSSPLSFASSHAITSHSSRFSQLETLDAVLQRVTTEVVVTSTGYLSRQVCSLRDRSRNIYLVGSMGLTTSFALGLDVAFGGEIGILAIDGDGSALMHLGGMATVATFGSTQYRHIIMDNGVYASTGGQPTSSPVVSFSNVARAAGYKEAANAADFVSLDSALDWLFAADGPALLEVKVDAESSNTPRVNIVPSAQVRRLRESLLA